MQKQNIWPTLCENGSSKKGVLNILFIVSGYKNAHIQPLIFNREPHLIIARSSLIRNILLGFCSELNLAKCITIFLCWTKFGKIYIIFFAVLNLANCIFIFLGGIFRKIQLLAYLVERDTTKFVPFFFKFCRKKRHYQRPDLHISTLHTALISLFLSLPFFVDYRNI